MKTFTRIFVLFMICTVVIPSLSNAQDSRVRLGLENLLENRLDLIEGKRVGIIANHTSVDPAGSHIVELLSKHAKVTAIFGPEHGVKGNAADGETIKDESLQNIPVYSLYGQFRTPTPEMLKDVDVLVYDIQDVGVKFYTYISSMFLGMCAAKREGKPVIVLDRPNPVDASRVEGAVTNPAFASFVGVIPLTARYGMTVGELAQLFNNETYGGFAINSDLTVVKMENYRRDMWYDETGLPWLAPSPNMPILDTATVYPGLCLIEGTNLSEGRGTDAPFLQFGAPYINAKQWLDSLPEDVLSGVELQTVSFTPKTIPGVANDPKHEGKKCNGLRINIIDRDKFQPIPLATALICSARKLYPGEFTMRKYIDSLWGNEDFRTMVSAGMDYKTILDTTTDGVARFNQVRQKYLLYP